MAPEGLSLTEAYNRYLEWMAKSSDYRPATRRKYTDNLRVVVDTLGDRKAVGMLSKDDAVRLRDRMKAAGKSATTIFLVFSMFHGFLRWPNKEGLISSPYVVENFLIDLPTVRKVNTPIIPPSKADEAMACLPDWTLIPRIHVGFCRAVRTGLLGFFEAISENELVKLPKDAIVVRYRSSCTRTKAVGTPFSQSRSRF